MVKYGSVDLWLEWHCSQGSVKKKTTTLLTGNCSVRKRSALLLNHIGHDDHFLFLFFFLGREREREREPGEGGRAVGEGQRTPNRLHAQCRAW